MRAFIEETVKIPQKNVVFGVAVTKIDGNLLWSETFKVFGHQEIPYSFIFGYVGSSLEDTLIINSVWHGGMEDIVECKDKVVLA